MTMADSNKFKDEAERNIEDRRIFNKLNGYTQDNGINVLVRRRISANKRRILKSYKERMYYAEKQLMRNMINDNNISMTDKSELDKALKSFKYYNENVLPDDNKIKRYLTKGKIEYMYNNIHNMLDGKITFKLDNNDIKKINIINNLIDTTNNLPEDENKEAFLLLKKHKFLLILLNFYLMKMLLILEVFKHLYVWLKLFRIQVFQIKD